MSDATSQPGHTNDHDDGPHEGPIKTPKQLILAVFYAFVIPIVVIAGLTVLAGGVAHGVLNCVSAAPPHMGRKVRKTAEL